MINLDKYEKVRDVNLTVDNLIDFESDIVKHWEAFNTICLFKREAFYV